MDAVKGQEKQEIVISTDCENGYLKVMVSDNGCGIEPENLTKIFDPFFTTKPTGEGTGLGLSICRNIITSHKGEMSCESKVGLGTTFKMVLPIEKSKENIQWV